MNKEELFKLLEEIENEKRSQRFFKKVNFSEFKRAFLKYYDVNMSEDKIKEIYEDLPSPCRSTINAGGYDFYAPYDFTLKVGETRVIPTGFKVHMNNDETFNLFIRSGTGFKYNVRLSNQIGIIDADYYDNESNEGHMLISFTNHGDKEWVNESYGLSEDKKAKIVQGLFMPYYVTRDDKCLNKIRKGGLGSTSGKEK